MKRLSFFIFIVFNLSVRSQTNVTTNILTSTVWTQANSPYVLKNDIILYQGATLNVQPGVEIQVDSGYKFNIEGILNLNGNPTDSILIHSSATSPSRTYWYGISMNGQGKTSMKYTILQDSEHGLEHFNSALPQTDSVFITHSRFSHNSWAMSYMPLHPPYVFVTDCNFNNNNEGMRSMANPGMWIQRCNFFNNTGGIGDTLGAGSLNVTIDNCNFYNNRVGASVNYDGPGGGVLNSNFYNNGFAGVNLTLEFTPHPFTNNRIYNNAVGVLCNVNISGADSLNGLNCAICSNTVNFKNTGGWNIQASNICWCSNDSATIRAGIIDGFNTNSLGLVFFSPYLLDCDLSNPASIKQNDPSALLSVYPNPFTQDLYFTHADNLLPAQADVFDVMGRLVYSGRLTEKHLDLQFLKEGIYNIVLRGDTYSASKKIIKLN